MTNSTTKPLPRPKLTIVPAKPGLPEQGGSLDLLVTVEVEAPEVEVDRKPISLALVIDRSGSMSGAPLAAAKEAVRLAVTMLLPGDWVSVVAFDDGVEVPQPLVKLGSDLSGVLAAIGTVEARGSTNLFGGWAEGLSQVMACPDPDALARVVLLSDGQANVGVVDPGQIAQDVAQAAGHGVTTTAMGLSQHYDERLLRGMADAGRGSYVFLEGVEDVARAFEVEIAGLSSLRGRNLRLTAEPLPSARLAHADANAASAGLGADANGVMLTDLIAGLRGDYLVSLALEPGRADVSLKLTWDDTISGAPDEESYPVKLPWLAAAEWEAAPLDARVAEARRLAELAGVKRDLAEATRREDEGVAMRLIGRIRALVGSLPAGAERTREEAELAKVEELVRQRAYYSAARYSDVKSRDRYQGMSEEKRLAMLLQASDAIGSKRSAMLRSELDGVHAAAAAASRAGQAARSAFGPAPTGHPHAIPAAPAPTQAASATLYEASYPKGRVQVVMGDITQQAVEAVVNSTNRGMMGVSGVDGALARAGGPRHVAAMRAVGGMDYGQAVFTPAFGIPARYVVHTAALPWNGGGREVDLLGACHRSVFDLAAQLGAKSIALPAIGTGRYGFPAAVAAQVATGVARKWLESGAFDLIRFVVFDDGTGKAFVEALEGW